jgi:hypothetical protein
MRASWENEKFYKKSEEEQLQIKKHIEEKSKEKLEIQKQELEISRIEKQLKKDINKFAKENEIYFIRRGRLCCAYYIKDQKINISFTFRNLKDKDDPKFAKKILLEKLYFEIESFMVVYDISISTINKNTENYVLFKILEKCLNELNQTSLAAKIIHYILHY